MSHGRVANVPAHLLLVAAAREVTHAHRRPPEFGHHLRKLTVCAGGALPLWHLEKVQQRLSADPLEPIEADLESLSGTARISATERFVRGPSRRLLLRAAGEKAIIAWRAAVLGQIDRCYR